MSPTPKREPLLSDAEVDAIRTSKFSEAIPAFRVRDIYEAARAKDAELIQMAVDACSDPHRMSLAAKFLAAAKVAGFTPTPDTDGN